MQLLVHVSSRMLLYQLVSAREPIVFKDVPLYFSVTKVERGTEVVRGEG